MFARAEGPCDGFAHGFEDDAHRTFEAPWDQKDASEPGGASEGPEAAHGRRCNSIGEAKACTTNRERKLMLGPNMFVNLIQVGQSRIKLQDEGKLAVRF